MMRKVQLAVLLTFVLFSLSGCGNIADDYDESTLIVKKNGSLQEVAVENFEGSSVNAEDLTTYIEEQIADYNDENGKKCVKQKSIDTEDMSNVKLVLAYHDMECYNGFNSLTCSLGTFEELEGELKGDFTSAEDKKVKLADLEGTDKAKVLVFSEKTNVVIDGEILYYNNEVEMKDEVVTTSGEGDAVIIFK